VGVASITCRSARTTTERFITSFATRDGRYRVYACDVCRRYLKRTTPRNACVRDGGADSIASLPLDAQRCREGYVGDYCCGCGWVAAGLLPTIVAAFVDTQLNRFRASMKRPAFERAPRTTTADFLTALREPEERRETVARLRNEPGLPRRTSTSDGPAGASCCGT